MVCQRGLFRKFAKVWQNTAKNLTIEVHDVNELEIVAETSIGIHVAFGVENMRQVSETFVPPIVKATKARTSTALGI
jgi:hypothetical protein